MTNNVIDLYKYRRARRGKEMERMPTNRARPQHRRDGRFGGLVSIGIVTEELLRQLRET